MKKRLVSINASAWTGQACNRPVNARLAETVAAEMIAALTARSTLAVSSTAGDRRHLEMVGSFFVAEKETAPVRELHLRPSRSGHLCRQRPSRFIIKMQGFVPLDSLKAFQAQTPRLVPPIDSFEPCRGLTQTDRGIALLSACWTAQRQQLKRRRAGQD